MLSPCLNSHSFIPGSTAWTLIAFAYLLPQLISNVVEKGLWSWQGEGSNPPGVLAYGPGQLGKILVAAFWQAAPPH